MSMNVFCARLSKNAARQEDEMARIYGPGRYTIKLSDAQKPSLYASDGTTPIDHPTFQTFGEGRLVFKIEDLSEIEDPLSFEETPITWSEPEPPGNTLRLEGKTSLTLDVCHPAAWKEAQEYHFKLHLTRGGIDQKLWTHDGTVVVDPTIVENPPNG
jgi:hypothetical protein